MLQPGKFERPLEPVRTLRGWRDRDNALTRLAQQLTINPCKSVLADLALTGSHNLKVPARTERLGNEILRLPPQALCQVFTGDDQVASELVLAPNDNMRVRMAGIVMIDSQPVEACSEVTFHPVHELTRVRFEITHLVAVFRRYDDPELVAVAFAAFEEFPRPNPLFP